MQHCAGDLRPVSPLILCYPLAGTHGTSKFSVSSLCTPATPFSPGLFAGLPLRFPFLVSLQTAPALCPASRDRCPGSVLPRLVREDERRKRERGIDRVKREAGRKRRRRRGKQEQREEKGVQGKGERRGWVLGEPPQGGSHPGVAGQLAHF